jgi:hypothetical protein
MIKTDEVFRWPLRQMQNTDSVKLRESKALAIILGGRRSEKAPRTSSFLVIERAWSSQTARSKVLGSRLIT